jgi:hypothetical protein
MGGRNRRAGGLLERRWLAAFRLRNVPHAEQVPLDAETINAAALWSRLDQDLFLPGWIYWKGQASTVPASAGLKRPR